MAEALARYLPITQWLARYERGFLPRDLVGGLAVWAVLVPQAVAYAALAGAPPQAGLFAALAAGIAYAVFGTCGQLDVGPSSTIAITSAAILVPVAREFPNEDYTSLLAALALVTGAVLVAAGLMRLGFVSEFLARPVLVGFISGVGIVIIAGQLPKLLGLRVQSGNVPETLWRTLKELDELGWETPALGAGALLALLVLRRFAPRVPWALVVAAVSVGLSRAFDLEAQGVPVIADVPAGLPTPGIPALGLGEIGALSGGAAALALITIAESIGAARSLAAERGYRIDSNQELVALGASNAAAGLLQGFPVDASLSRSAVASGAGVRTRLSSVARHPEYTTVPGLVLFRFSNELFFANASYFRDEAMRLVDQEPEPRTLLVDATAVTHVDTTAVAMLDELIETLAGRGITFELARLSGDARAMLERGGVLERLGPGAVHPSIHTGVTAFLRRESGATPSPTPPAGAPAAPS